MNEEANTRTPSAVAAHGPLFSLLERLVAVKPEEAAAVGWSWLYVFAVLSSYYILRPIREQMGVAGGVHNLQWLFTGTLAAMLLLNVPFSVLVKRLPRTRFIPITYRFFAVVLLLFALALYWADAAQTVWVGRIFFIWVSVFNLFVVSIFWQLIVDIFSAEDGKRLFGFIGVGATIGAISGSWITKSLAQSVPTAALLIGSAILLEVAVFCVGRVSRQSARLHSRPVADGAERVVGGSVLAGIINPFRSVYLSNLSLFIVLFTITSTFLYFQQATIVSRSFHDPGTRTSFFAGIDYYVNVVTLLVQLFFTGRIVRLLGIGPTLGLLPAFTLVGFAALAAVPTAGALVAVQVLRRSGDYAVARPAREVLYTVVPREDRYKAKSFIDTVVYRVGDQVGAWSFALLSSNLGLGATGIAIVTGLVSVAWLANALWLGRRQELLAQNSAPAPAGGTS